MIGVLREAGAVTVVGELPAGWLAFVDADWLELADAGSPLPAILAGPSELVRSWDGHTVALPSGRAAEETVASALAHVAQEAVEAIPADIPREAIEAEGRGAVSARVRSLLGAAGGAARPLAVVVPTGRIGHLQRATGLVEDGGLVVVAGGPDAPGPAPFDLYRDVHRRGLRVLALPGPLEHGLRGEDQGPSGFVPPAVAALEVPLPAGTWYRLSAGPE